MATEVNNLRAQIDKQSLPDEARKVALKEVDRLSQMSPAVAEYTISRTYLDWILGLPWNKTTEDSLDIDAAARVLDEQHFGLGKVKERLLEYIAVFKLKNTLNTNASPPSTSSEK